MKLTSLRLAFLASLSSMVFPAYGVNIPPEEAIKIEGEHVKVNDNDDDANDVWDFLDQEPEEEDLDIVEFKITAAGNPLKEGKLKLTLPEQPEPVPLLDEEGEPVLDDDGEPVEIILPPNTIYWKDQKKTEPFIFENEYDVPAAGKILTFYVEGITPTEAFDTLAFKAELKYEDYEPVEGEFKFGVTEIDTDVDSLNNGNPETLEQDQEEDQREHEEVSGNRGLRLFPYNFIDTDENDFPDHLQGLGIAELGEKGDVAPEYNYLTPVPIRLPELFDPETMKITLVYDESIPRVGEGLEYTDVDGHEMLVPIDFGDAVQESEEGEGTVIILYMEYLTTLEDANRMQHTLEVKVTDEEGAKKGTFKVDGNLIEELESPETIDKVNLFFPTPESTVSRVADAFTDTSGWRFRRVNLNGSVATASKGAAEAESDENSEETYIDSMTRQLRHNTSDIYIPLVGGQLNLSVKRTLQSSIIDSNTAISPNQLHQPFGQVWSSNVGAVLTLSRTERKRRVKEVLVFLD